MSDNLWRWQEGFVNTGDEHFKITYGEWGDPRNPLVALVGPPRGRCFVVQFLMRQVPDQPEISKIRGEVESDLNYWLIEHPREYPGTGDPWKYLIYYAENSEAEMRSMVHWSYYPGGNSKMKKEKSFTKELPEDKKTFGLHPDEKLRQLFSDKPYQGQVPEKAKVIIFGIDANYSPKLLEGQPGFDLIEEYHQDGVKFWRNQQHKDNLGIVHHPFLDENFPRKELKDGVRYHEKFHKMDLPSDRCADHISFVELLNVPTCGRVETKEDKNEFRKLLNNEKTLDHLRRLDQLVSDNHGDKKLIILCDTIIKKLGSIKKELLGNAAVQYGDLFKWLPKDIGKFPNPELRILKLDIGTRNDVYKIIHLSWASNQELREIKNLILSHC